MAKPVYALIGSDALMQQEALTAVLRELPRDAQRSDYDGETAELAQILDELRSFALFGSGKVVVVRNAEQFVSRFRSQMEEYVSKPSASATLVLRFSSLPSNQRIYKLLVKVGKIESCAPPKDLSAWIIERGRAVHGLSIAPTAARFLADLIGDQLGRIDNELAKLALTYDSRKIDEDQIAGAVVFQREREMWDLTNALGAGNPAEAVSRWRQLVQADSSAQFRAVTWLCLWLENVRKALAMLARGQDAWTIGQTLRIWPREQAQHFVQTVKSLGQPGLARAVDLLAQIDYQTKTGVGEAAENVERFLLSLGTELKHPIPST
jgi:DNA polymerase-3 subunit delta